jgi:hypothetical protein
MGGEEEVSIFENGINYSQAILGRKVHVVNRT